MGKAALTSILSLGLGLILFILSAWFLRTIEIKGKPNYEPNDPGYVRWENNRRKHLIWGGAAITGISIGLFQFIFSAAYISFVVTEQQAGRIWNLANLILHSLFLVCMLYSLVVSFHGLVTSESSLSGSLICTVFFISEIIEILFLITHLYFFEKEYEFFGTVTKIFTCEELKEKLASYQSRKFGLRPRSIRRERLVEESIPV